MAEALGEAVGEAEAEAESPAMVDKAVYSPAAMLRGLIRTMRPHQWVKNLLFVPAPLIFAQELLNFRRAWHAGLGLIFFCLLASSVYVLNDLVDVEADRAHPVKKKRPIASGQVSEGAARWAILLLAGTAIGGGLLLLGPAFAAATASYLALNLGYSYRLKHIPYLDVLCITAGFLLRVLAGAAAADVPPSVYLLVVTFLLSTFLGLGKRMHELSAVEREDGKAKTRRVLERYSPQAVRVLLYLTGAATVIVYVIYTIDPATRATFETDYLVLTTPFTLFGVLRFAQLVRGHGDAESPTEQMLKDKPFIANLAVWSLVVVAIIYLT